MSALSDTLRLAQRWRDAGVPNAQADKMVAALAEELDQGVATKTDLKALELSTRASLESLEQRLTIKVGAMLAGAVALIVALLKALP